MPEYIEREAVIDSLNRLCERVCQYSKAQRANMCGACPLGDAFIVIEDDITAADVRPVVRGRWLGKDYYNDDRPVPYDPNAHGQWGCFCSECGLDALRDGEERDVPSRYCPNCGADMREAQT